jgi:hypothetical protein
MVLKEDEVVRLNTHAKERIESRLNKMSKNNELTLREDEIIRCNLNNILVHKFNHKKSYGIFLGGFRPNPNSKLYTITNKWNMGIPFYEIYSDGKDDITNDSTGDEFWVIVRENVIKTLMLRKRIQRQFANRERNDMGGLGVDIVIFNFDKFLVGE